VKQIGPDSVEVAVTLGHIDSVELAGKTVKSGDTVAIPLRDLRVGLNKLPFKGEGLGPDDGVEINLTAKQVLKPACDVGGKGWVMSKASSGIKAGDCAVEGGEIVVPLSLPEGATVAVEPGRVDGSTLYFDVTAKAPELPVKGANFDQGRAKEQPAKVTVTWSDGKTWTDEVEVSYRGSVVGAWFDRAPESLRALGRKAADPKRFAAFEAAGHYWAVGETEGKKLGDIDLLVRIEERSEPRSIGTCTFRTTEGGVAKAPANAVDHTFVAYDVEGNEVARTTLKAKGCPDWATFKKGDTITSVPGDGNVRAWVKTLLK
jgi:hypothetical protein